MDFKILASGNNNAHLYNNKLLVDIGVPFSVIKDYVYDIDYVFITHIHTDHLNIATLKRLVSIRPSIKIMSHAEVMKKLIDIPDRNKVLIKANKTYKLSDMLIHPFKLVHNVYNLGLKMYINNKKIIHATDTYTLDHVVAKDYDYYFVERNHCEVYLKEVVDYQISIGKYAHGTQSKDNHLSIQRLNKWLKKNAGKDSFIYYLHESETYLK